MNFGILSEFQPIEMVSSGCQKLSSVGKDGKLQRSEKPLRVMENLHVSGACGELRCYIDRC